jgi:hypothetical protein
MLPSIKKETEKKEDCRGELYEVVIQEMGI